MHLNRLSKRQSALRQYEELGEAMVRCKVDRLKQQHSQLKRKLNELIQHRQAEISSNPVLVEQIRRVCFLIGVDPLQSPKGLLDSTRFYEELAVQIVDVCLHYRDTTGGLVSEEVVVQELSKKRSTAIKGRDVQQAIDAMAPLCSGYKSILINSVRYIQSVPMELSQDDHLLMNSDMCISKQQAVQALRWTDERFTIAINTLIRKGMVWIDQDSGTFWLAFKFFGGGRGDLGH